MNSAVIILNWNGVEMMRRFLPSVVEHSPEADVIVADNGSTDDSLSMLERVFPTVKTIALDKNYGFAEGYNRAIKQVEGKYEYVVLLNSDVEVTEDWLSPLVAFMDEHPDCAACQPKLLAYHDKQMFEYAGAAGGFVDKFGYPYCRGRIFSTVEKDEGQYDKTLEIHWATGACMMVRMKDYLDYGGLDGRFFAHNEEIDLCWRLRILGKKIYCVTDSKVYHVGGGTLPQGNPRKTHLNFRNNLTMLFKNLPEKDLKKVMRARYWLDRVAMLQSLAKGNIADVKAIMKARKDFEEWKADFEKDRADIQLKRKLHGSQDLTNKSILWQYFALGKKKFSEIFA
ncbi:MAG: glycosyltransferase family 2 protein [Bacteroidaceae bacterium]|nr:glycosyltransferase family 2 protein [Bacteroidaceae bacterium]